MWNMFEKGAFAGACLANDVNVAPPRERAPYHFDARRPTCAPKGDAEVTDHQLVPKVGIPRLLTSRNFEYVRRLASK